MTSLNFKGKEFVFNHHLSIPFHPLEIQPELGVGEPSLEGNLLIHGDNLLALKALMPYYANTVDCIFIDPPYNTGSEDWCYNDNVNSPMIQEWLDSNPVGIEDGLRHDKWCAMMWPRLRLLHELLSPDGSLWVSIDNNESFRLRSILEEIFGESGFIGEIAWVHSDSSNNDARQFSEDHNTIFVYSKNPDWRPNFLNYPDRQSHYSNKNDDPRGPYYDGGDISSPKLRENLRFTIAANMFKSTHSSHHLEPCEIEHEEIQSPTNGWRWSRETMSEKFSNGELRISDDGKRVIRRRYLQDMGGLPPSSLFNDHAQTGHTRRAKTELKRLFPERLTRDLFPTPKPLELIAYILELATAPGDIILDSFAGSGTTAHAVLNINSENEEEIDRRFILIELEDYADSETAERVRRAINGNDNSEPLGGTFTYCELGQPLDPEGIISGDNLPTYEQLGQYLFNLVTNNILDNNSIDEAIFHLGETEREYVWMIYRNDLDWLKSSEAALTLTRAREFAQHDSEKRHLVIAPAKYVSQKMLDENNIPVEFVPLPYSLFLI